MVLPFFTNIFVHLNFHLLIPPVYNSTVAVLLRELVSYLQTWKPEFRDSCSCIYEGCVSYSSVYAVRCWNTDLKYTTAVSLPQLSNLCMLMNKQFHAIYWVDKRSQINATIDICITMIQSKGACFPHFNESILAYINTSKLS
jgi:hypothetical protein